MANNFINTDLFPPIDAGSNYDWKSWLFEIVKYANDPNVDPLLKGSGNSYDYTKHLPDFDALATVGDARFTAGEMLSGLMDKFYPSMQLYIDIQQAGGCQTIENYVCDENGIPIKQLEYSCPNANIDNLKITQDQITSYITTTYDSKKQQHLQDFVDFIKNNYIANGYTVSLNILENSNVFFFVEADKKFEKVFFRYYMSESNNLSNALGIPITNIKTSDLNDRTKYSINDINNLTSALNQPINNYIDNSSVPTPIDTNTAVLSYTDSNNQPVQQTFEYVAQSSNTQSLIDALNNINDNISSMQDSISFMQDSISTLTDNVSGIQDDISGIQDDISGIQDNIATLTDNVSTLTDSVSGLTDDVSLLQDNVSTLTDSVSGLTDDVSTLQSQMTQAQADIYALQNP
jgi:hypothetical protein